MNNLENFNTSDKSLERNPLRQVHRPTLAEPSQQRQRCIISSMQDIGQSNNKWNGYAIDYQAESLPLTDSLATHFSSTQIIPPRPQRPFTEYNVFFRLERELLLQGKPGTMDCTDKNTIAQSIIGSGKEIESADIAALRPPRYRHLILSNDWFKVGNKNKSPSIKPNTSPSIISDKKPQGKFSFLELTKLISSNWKEVCSNDTVTKDFCKLIADGEAARYKQELEEYREKYGIAAAKGKKRQSRKHGTSESQKKTKRTKQVRDERKTLDGIFPAVDEGFFPLQQNLHHSQFSVSNLYDSSYRYSYDRQHPNEVHGRTSSPPINSFVKADTSLGTHNDFSQPLSYKGATTLNSPFTRIAKSRLMLQDECDRLQRMVSKREYLRQNSAFGCKYDFLDSEDDDVIDAKVEEYLRGFESKVFQQMKTFNVSKCSRSVGCQFDLDLESSNQSSDVAKNDTRSNGIEATNTAKQTKKLRSLHTNDWALFTKHVEIRDD